HSTLMPYDRSNAAGDFNDDFGLRGRLQAVNGVDLIPVRRPLGDRGSQVVIQPYRGAPRLADKSEVFAVVFRYGLGFADLEKGTVLTFLDYDAYKKYRASEGLTFNN